MCVVCTDCEIEYRQSTRQVSYHFMHVIVSCEFCALDARNKLLDLGLGLFLLFFIIILLFLVVVRAVVGVLAQQVPVGKVLRCRSARGVCLDSPFSSFCLSCASWSSRSIVACMAVTSSWVLHVR